MAADDTISPDTVSLAVWDVPMPVVAGERFAIKVGAKSADGALASGRVEVTDAAGALVASGTLGATPLAGTEALAWTTLELPAPSTPQISEYVVRLDTASTRFTVVAAPKPEHTLTVTVTEQDSKVALGGVEIRLGPFHARTDKVGRAQLRIGGGAYRLELWRPAHAAPPRPITIDRDTNLALSMVHVPEEHPDARWVR
jgi:hypothetical protein